MLRLLCWSWPPFLNTIGYVDPITGCFMRCNLDRDTLISVRAYSRAAATSGLALLWPSIQSRMCVLFALVERLVSRHFRCLEEADLETI